MLKKSGYVYLIQYPNSYYKIGCSRKPWDRFKQLQKDSPVRLYLLHTFYCLEMFKEEKKLQLKYSQKKEHRGEYFKLSDLDVLDIATHKGESLLLRSVKLTQNSQSLDLTGQK